MGRVDFLICFLVSFKVFAVKDITALCCIVQLVPCKERRVKSSMDVSEGRLLELHPNGAAAGDMAQRM